MNGQFRKDESIGSQRQFGKYFPAPSQKKAILELIDAKINSDMKEVIAKMNELESKLEVKIQMTHDKLSNEIKIVYWVIGIAMAVILFVVARK